VGDMAFVYVDIETHSELELTACGAHVYARDPSTDVYFVCFAVDDGPVQVWKPGAEVPAVFANPAGFTFVFDNWTFERAILEHVLIPRYGFVPIPTAQMDCAQRKALASAFPAELGLRCLALGLPYRKDEAARRAMLRLARSSKRKTSKRKTVIDPVIYEHDLELTRQRCMTDVEMTRATYNHPRIRPLSSYEQQVMRQDAVINDRGVCANVPFLEAVQVLATHELPGINAKLAALTDGAVTSVNQRDRILAAINARGHKLATLGKRSVAAALASKTIDVFTCEVLTLRKRGAFASPKKSKKLLDYANADDHRIRGALRYHGAGTGRWTSVGAQLHNLTRNDAELPVTLVDALIAGDYAELARYGDPLKVASGLSRAALCAAPGFELICADLAGIESRIVAWLAGEAWKLDLFRRYDATGDELLDPYRVLAHVILKGAVSIEAITAAQRQLGKYSELAFGFGGSIGAWRGIAGDDGRSDKEILEIVRVWRGRHPMIRAFWRRLMHAALKAIRTKQAIPVNSSPLSPIVAAFDGYALTLTLPSGRVINYPAAHIVVDPERGTPNIEFMDNAKTAPKVKKKAGEKVTSGWRSVRAWSGIFVENVVSGIARDLLAAAIDRAEARGWPVVHHSHDEVVVEMPIRAISKQDALASLLEAPAWAAGLPLGGKVRSGPLFFEGPMTAEPPAQAVEIPVLVDADENELDENELDENELDENELEPAVIYVHDAPDTAVIAVEVTTEIETKIETKVEAEAEAEIEARKLAAAYPQTNGRGAIEGNAMGPYAQCAEPMVERGYAAIPIMTGTKAPGFFCAGQWMPLPAWQRRFLNKIPSERERELWSKGETGVGVVGGRASHGLIPVDIDTDDPGDQGRIGERAARNAGAKNRRQGRDEILLRPGHHGLEVLEHRQAARLRPHRRRPADAAAADDPPRHRGAVSLARPTARGVQAGRVAAPARRHLRPDRCRAADVRLEARGEVGLGRWRQFERRRH